MLMMSNPWQWPNDIFSWNSHSLVHNIHFFLAIFSFCTIFSFLRYSLFRNIIFFAIFTFCAILSFLPYSFFRNILYFNHPFVGDIQPLAKWWPTTWYFKLYVFHLFSNNTSKTDVAPWCYKWMGRIDLRVGWSMEHLMVQMLCKSLWAVNDYNYIMIQHIEVLVRQNI